MLALSGCGAPRRGVVVLLLGNPFDGLQSAGIGLIVAGYRGLGHAAAARAGLDRPRASEDATEKTRDQRLTWLVGDRLPSPTLTSHN